MRNKFSYLFIISTFAFGIGVSQTGKVGINTITPQAMLHVKDSSVLFSGAASLPVTRGNPPASGTGIRMMWYPDKASFRVGRVNGVNWDKDSIGDYSFATGLNTKALTFASTATGFGSSASGEASTAMGVGTSASGEASTAMGVGTSASGYASTAMGQSTNASGGYTMAIGYGSSASGSYSTAMGQSTNASGSYSTAMGHSTNASGDYSTAMGYASSASGDFSTAMGRSTNASGDNSTAMGYNVSASGDNSTTIGNFTNSRPFSSLVIGQYNDSIITSSPTSWVETDPVFIIGNGFNNASRKNAFVVFKNGNMNADGEIYRTSTGTANIVPICYGSVSNTGAISSGTSNFSVTKGPTGQYDIDIIGESYSSNGYTTNVTVISFSAPRMATTVASAGGILTVRIWDAGGVLQDGGFHFIVYKQ